MIISSLPLSPNADSTAWLQAAFKAEQEAALLQAEKASNMPGAFVDSPSPLTPGVRTRSQARKML